VVESGGYYFVKELAVEHAEGYVAEHPDEKVYVAALEEVNRSW